MSKKKKSGADARLQDVSVAPRERWQHGGEYDVVEVDLGEVLARHVQRVAGPVERLAVQGRVGAAEVAAAARWVRDYEWPLRSSYVDPHTAGIRASGANRGPEERLARGVAAAIRRDQVLAALGDDAVGWLVDHVHMARSLSSRLAGGSVGGNQLRPLVDRFVVILGELAAHYADVDRHASDGRVRPRPAPRAVSSELSQAA